MRILFLIILGSIISTTLTAQHHHYLFIQSDQQQAFYVKNGNEVMSSSSSGFLIIPKLKDTVYSFIIGFPGEKFPPYQFRFSSFKKDRGMSLKNFEEKGWGLFDLQSMEIIMGEKVNSEEQKEEVAITPITRDIFTSILASVIDDPGLLGTELVGKNTASYAVVRAPVEENPPVIIKTPEPEIKNPEPKQDKLTESQTSVSKSGEPVKQTRIPEEVKKEVQKPADLKQNGEPVVKTELPAESPSIEIKNNPPPLVSAESTKQDSGIKAIVKEATLQKSEATASAQIEKIGETNITGDLILVYLDRLVGGTYDTVTISIPYSEEYATKNTEKKNNIETAKTVKSPVPVSRKDEKKSGESSVKSGDSGDTTSMAIRKTENRTDCRRNASDRDIDQVRRRIIAIREEDDMVTAALREFKQKCFTTEQIRSVSFVFVTEKGKYKLLDAAYPYVFDPGNYKSLEHLLNDPYYINRFKALIREN